MGSEKWGSGPGQGTCRTAGKDRKVRLILFDNITMGMAYTAAQAQGFLGEKNIPDAIRTVPVANSLKSKVKYFIPVYFISIFCIINQNFD